MTAEVKSVLIQISSMCVKSVAFSIMQIRPQQIRLSQIGVGQTIPSSAILSRASSRMYMLQQHMAVTCCQGSLSPGLASPAPGQMAAHWAPKTNCGAQDTQPAPLLLPWLFLTAWWPLFLTVPPHMPALFCMPVDSDLIGFPSEPKEKR